MKKNKENYAPRILADLLEEIGCESMDDAVEMGIANWQAKIYIGNGVWIDSDGYLSCEVEKGTEVA